MTDATPEISASKLFTDLYLAIAKLTYQMPGAALFEGSKLTPVQWSILAYLQEHGVVTTRHLVKAVYQPQGDVKAGLSALTNAGYVSVTGNATDPKNSTIEITDNGRKALAGIEIKLKTVVVEAMGDRVQSLSGARKMISRLNNSIAPKKAQ